jgi:hypothetical protein
MIETALWSFTGILVLQATINAVFMLVSPRRWFQLPRWLRTAGSFTEDRYASGSGAVHIRLVGGLVLAGTALFWYLVLSS